MKKNRKPIVEVVADGLDALVDGRGFNKRHLKATTLANMAPELLKSCKDLVRLHRLQCAAGNLNCSCIQCRVVRKAKEVIARTELK